MVSGFSNGANWTFILWGALIEHLGIESDSVDILVVTGLFALIEWFNRKYGHSFRGKFKWAKIIGVIALLLILGVYSDYQ